MKRISKKMLSTFVQSVSDKKPSRIAGDEDNLCYYSKIDGAYFTREGMEDNGFKFLLKRGITTELQNACNISDNTVNIGFNPEEQKWYGWSHRALYDFGIGSSVQKGDCAYCPTDKDDFLDDCVKFWDDDSHLNIDATHVTEENVDGVCVTWLYGNKIPNKVLRNTCSSTFTPYPDTYGKGEWTAKTLEDAKQMAIDFACSVS